MSIYEDTVEILERELGEITDGYTVMDLVKGCVEPGYSYDDETVLVMGNWNPKRFPRNDDPPLTEEENFGPRLAEMLDEVGAECEWYDEWVRCEDCFRAFRGQPDSYSWQMYGAFVENAAGYICAECLIENFEDYVQDYVDNPDTAITWADESTLIENGWEKWNGHQYENGWHPGQNDDPRKIYEAIKSENDDLQIIFLIDNVGQFDIRFSAWIREQG